MNLVVDVGNSTIRFGVYTKDQFGFSFFCETSKKLRSKDFKKLILTKLKENHILIYGIEFIMYSSVVPYVDKILLDVLKIIFPVRIHNINEVRTFIDYDIPDVNSVGSDLIADIYGAIKKNYYPCAIVDVGTANKVLLLDNKGRFITCVIMPGIKLSYNVLCANAALLKNDISHDVPLPLLEIKRTPEAILGGVTYTASYGIDGILDEYESKLGYKIKRIITGGDANIVYQTSKTEFIHDDHLLLDGLNKALIELEGVNINEL